MFTRKLLGLAAAIVLVGACSEVPTQPQTLGPDLLSVAADGNPIVGSARGSGHAPCGPSPSPVICGDGPLRTFSFTALVHADGSVKGKAQTINRYNGNRLKADIDCVNFFGAEQNRAWMIGTVTHTNRASFPVGATIGFAVADNGEGHGSAPDQITGFGLSDPSTTAVICSGGNDALLDFFFDNVFGFDAISGNVQVQAP